MRRIEINASIIHIFLYYCIGWINAAVVALPPRPLLLVSLDGIRADKFDEFVLQNPSCNFNRIINNGIKADYMKPSFPSQTFPNHWTLATGVYPETHGVVGNKIYDPTADRIISLASDSKRNEANWWNRSEPIWLTARNQGLKTATSFWPGSEVWKRTADIFLNYNSYDPKSRIDELISWFLKFDLDFAAFYFNEPDVTGHAFGPDSQEYRDKIKEVDGIIGYLLDSLENNNLLSNMNLVLVSDHGMAKAVSKPFVIQEYVDQNLIDFNRTVLNYVSNIYPKNMSQLSQLYDALHNLPNTTIYYKKDVPAEFHFSNSDRIGPIVAISDEGYSLSNDPKYSGKAGIHGFNNSLVSMRAIFTAFGPDFKKGQKIEPFENVNIQPLLCKLLNLVSSQSNGTAEIFEPYLVSLDNSSQLFSIYGFILSVFDSISSYFD